MSTTDHPEPPPSRLDRELDEILSEASRRPISLQDRMAQKRAAARRERYRQVARLEGAGGAGRKVLGWATRLPLITALVLALAAVWLFDGLPLLSSLLALAAAVFIFVPFFVRPPSDDITYQKRWRGRPVGGPPRGASGFRGAIDAARDRLQR